MNGAHPVTAVVDKVYKEGVNITDQFTVQAGSITVTGGVDKLTESNTVVEGVNAAYTYTGFPIKPTPVVKYNGTTLTEGTDYTVTYTNNVKPGTVTMTITGKGGYQGEVTKTFEIVKAAGEITGTSVYTRKFGDSAFALDTVVNSGAALSYKSSNEAVAKVDADGLVTVVGSGDAVITVSAGETDCYTAPASFKVNVTVGLAEQKLTGTDSYNKTYGDAPFALNISGNKGELTYASSNPTVAAVENGTVTIKGAGKATITVKAAAVAGQYAAAEKTVTVEVAKKAVTISGITAEDKPYDGTTNVTINKDGMVFAGQVAGDELTCTVTGAFADANAGADKTVNLTLGFEHANYELAADGQTTTTATIEQAEVELPVAVAGLVFNNKEQTGVMATADYDVEGGSATNAGTHEATVTLKDAVNYKWAESFDGKLSWSIAKAEGQALTKEITRRYSSEQAIVITESDVVLENPGTVALNDWNLDDPDGILTGADGEYALATGLTADDAGKSATVTVKVDSNNYETSTLTVTVTVIDKNDVSDDLSFENGSAAYTGLAQTYETALYNGKADGIKYAYSETPVNAGSYTVTAIYEDEDNYGEKAVTFTVTPVDVTVADAVVETKTYDGATEAVVTEVTFEGLVNGETFDAADYTVSNAKFADANVGEKAVTYNVQLANTEKAANYHLVSEVAAASGEIEPLEVTVTVNAIADQTFNGKAQTPAVTVIAAGTVNGYELAEAVDYTVSYTNNTNVGTAKVTVSAKDGSNYTFTAVEGSFEIVKAELSSDVTADKIEVAYKSTDSAAINGIPADAGEVTYTYDKSVEGVEVTVKNGKITVTADTAEAGKVITIPVTVEMENYESVTVEVTVEVVKAKLPMPELHEDDAKVLDDLLTEKDFPVDGKLTWTDKDGNELDGTTEIKDDEEYTWVFKPDDSKNYEDLSDTYMRASDDSSSWLWGVILGGAAGGHHFDDVARYDWYSDAVDYVVREGLFEGVSEDLFDPNGNMTRAMLVTVLWRLEGSPKIYSYAGFDDVARGTWYTTAVAWAEKYDIVEGISETKFAPNASITREQLATILYRYADYKGLGLDLDADLSGYTDAGKISDYAKDGMQWAVTYGLMQGMTQKTLAPQGTATRAQVATMLMRFAEWFGL